MSIFFFTIIPIYVPFVCSKMLFETNDDGCMPALSWRQRWYGFAFCFCFGSITSLFSSLALVKRDIPSFAFLYTFGNLISICSTGFVWGPKKQCKKMFHKSRAIATTMYLLCIATTIVFAVADLQIKTPVKVGICICLIALQIIASFWYCLSYIPYARQIAKNFFTCF